MDIAQRAGFTRPVCVRERSALLAPEEGELGWWVVVGCFRIICVKTAPRS